MPLVSDHDDGPYEAKQERQQKFFIFAAKAALRVVRCAKATVRKHPGVQPAAILPPELLVDSFGLLSFNDRLHVSQVCQYWRRVALGAPLLWSTFAIGTSGRQGTDKLYAMLHRTQAVPLCVTLSFPPDDDAAAALGSHFVRLRALRCEDPPGSLDAPLLETLEVSRFQSDEVVLSEGYVGSSAQSLRVLQLRAFSTASTCPVFPRLREFRAVFTPETDITRLLELCPALESLTVWCDINLAVDPAPLFVTLPPGLTKVTINGLLLWSDPSYHRMRRWQGHRFRHLALSRVQDVSSALHLFGASLDAAPEEAWFMQILVEDNGTLVADNGVVTLSTRTGADSARAVVPAFPRSASREALWGLHAFTHIDRLAELRLAPLFFDVLVEDGALLPALAALAVVSDEARGDALPGRVHPVPGIRAPRLREFVLACGPAQAFRREAVQWFFATLPHYLREWMVYDDEKLERVALEGVVNKDALKKVGRRRSTIYFLAREVRLSAGAGTY